MKNTIITRTAIASLTAIALYGPAQLLAECADGERTVYVDGKILNNGQAGAPFTTLGVVKLRGDMPIGKLKCGIVGVEDSDTTYPLAFIHTISCEDKVTLVDGTKGHSGLTFKTIGTLNEDPNYCQSPYPPGSLSNSFTEYSTPIAGSGRGVLANVKPGKFIRAEDGGLIDVEGSNLTIEGTITCAGTIDMTFHGEMCM